MKLSESKTEKNDSIFSVLLLTSDSYSWSLVTAQKRKVDYELKDGLGKLLGITVVRAGEVTQCRKRATIV